MVASTIRSKVALVGVIDHCSQCHHALALAAPTPAASSSTWLCENCGGVYLASSVQQQSRAALGARQVPYSMVIKAMQSHIRLRSASVRQQDVQRLIECLEHQLQYVGPEKRTQQRHRVAAPINVISLDSDFRIAADPLRTIMTSVSAGGAAFVRDTSIVEPFLLLDFSPSVPNLAPAILRVTRVQQLRATYEIAGAFLSRIALESPPL